YLGTNTTGLHFTGGSINVASLKAPTGNRSWLGVDASGLAGSLVGVANVTLSVSAGSLKVNRAYGTGATPFNWTSLTVPGVTLPDLTAASGQSIHLTGTVALSAFGSLVATGTLGFDEGQVADAATVGTDAQAFAFTVSSGHVFAGVGGLLRGTTIG